MRWLKIFLWIGVIYAIFGRQQFYTSSLKQENPNRVKVERVQNFLKDHNSPLQGNAYDFVDASDKYKINYKILVAIAGVESTFGKNTPSCAHYNTFGYRSSSSPCGWYRFISYKEAIYTVAKTISKGNAYEDFRRSGRTYDLAKSYTALPTDWTQKVEYFIKLI